MATIKTPGMDDIAHAAAEMERTGLINEAAQRQLHWMETILDPNRRAGGDGPPISDDDRLAAIEGIADARIEGARATRLAKEARARHDAALAAERARHRAAIRAQMRPVAQKLDAALKACVVLNEQAQQLDARMHDCRSLPEREADAACGGGAFARVALRELSRDRYDHWRASLVAEDLLDEK